MSLGGNVPLTVLGTFENWGAQAAIGGTVIEPNDNTQNAYWYVIVDLNSLDVLANELSQDYNSLPGDVEKYLGQPDVLLMFTTIALTLDNLPQGSLQQTLQAIGAKGGLAKAEQINEQLGTGTIANFGYILVATFADDGVPGFEEFSTIGIPVMTLQLMPVTVGEKTTYTPINLG